MDAAVLDSYLSQIKELLPGYGDGFLAACLQVCTEKHALTDEGNLAS